MNRRGSDLFIVDNSDEGWAGLRYLHDWCSIARQFDIATGYFEIGALLGLDGEWQKLDKIRLLMGDETTQRTKRELLDAIRGRATRRLDESIEAGKDENPFLSGIPAIVEALRSKQIECRVYSKDKFHAKAYITHAKMDVVGAQALVGSSNFTRPGLTDNVELNIQVQSGREVAQLQEWFDAHWAEATEVTDDVLSVIERQTHLHTPFDAYAKALQEFFRGHEITASEWEEASSRMFGHLDRYQKEAYWAMMKIARQHGGAFLCDGVGLGKTFVGLMLIERLILHEGKRVVLFAPKGAKEGVWEPHLREWLPHIGGISGGSDFSNLAVFSHTDLTRGKEFPERFERIADLADAVVIDEAHHFRNTGRRGDPEKGISKSRYHRLFDLLEGEKRPKTVYMLTATPINNSLSDFRHMAELFTRGDEAYFARTIGVNHLTAHFNAAEKSMRRSLGLDDGSLAEHASEAGELLANDEVFRHLVVQRSRAYARASQEREGKSGAMFPKRLAPKVAGYSIRKAYGELLDQIEVAFSKEKPLFTLAIYYPLAYYTGDSNDVDPWLENRQKQVVGLIRTLFLKRFESSVRAFEMSCDRLLRKLLAFVRYHSQSDSEKRRLEMWMAQNAEVLDYAANRELDLWGEQTPGTDEDDYDEDIVPAEMLEAVEDLSRDEYNVAEMLADTYLDLDQVVRFLSETKRFDPSHDDKLKKLIRLLETKDLAEKKVIIFTEFADTARYIAKELRVRGVDGLEEIDSGSKANRAEVIKRFAPYYNGTSSAELEDAEIRVLISTDVLSEGLNLQDACRMINYDIHWNPVRLMQRIGRVDRRLSPEVEERLKADHPETAKYRGTIAYWNFLPPDELNAILTLYERVTQKTLMISETLGIEGRKLLTPDDKYDPLKEFNQAYEGETTPTEELHLEYQALLEGDPQLAERLSRLPGAVFSGRKRVSKGATGVFFCYALPALDTEKEEFTHEAGTTRWYLYDVDSDRVLEEPGEIIGSIRSKPTTKRRCAIEQATLIDLRAKVLKHIKDTYLKRVDAPIGVEPSLKCWMELNEG